MVSPSWGKQTSRNFKEIVREHSKEFDDFSAHEDLFLFDAHNPSVLEKFYKTLPRSIQKTMSIYTLGEEDLRLPINIKFDRDCLKTEESKLDLHTELSDGEMSAVKQTLIEICEMVDAEFVEITEDDEFVVRNDDFDSLTELLVAVVSTRLGGVKMKYIAPHTSEDSYRIYFEKNREDDPVLQRFIFIRSTFSFECPKCGTESLKSTSEGSGETTFCCLNCGLAAGIDYTDLIEEFEPDTPNNVVQDRCKDVLDQAYDQKNKIDIKSDLEVIGSYKETKVYEDICVYGHTEEDTELWIQREDSPVVIYHLENQEFLDEHMQTGEGMLCSFCNIQKNTNRVAGAYYEEGLGLHEKNIDICEECKEEVLNELRHIISNSDKSSDYLQKIM